MAETSNLLLKLKNFIYMFIASSLAVIFPLYLLHIGFSIEKIGVILAVAQFFFMLASLFFGILSDIIGTRPFNILSPLLNILSLVCYTFATPLFLVLGKIFEGIRIAAFWSVCRTDVINIAKDKKDATSRLSLYSAIRQVSNSLGKLLSGVFIVFLGFAGTFDLFIAILFFSFLMSFFIGDVKKPKRHQLSFRNVINKLRSTAKSINWSDALGVMLVGTVLDMTILFLFPIYFKDVLNFSYFDVGLLIAFITFVSSLFMMLAVRKKIPMDFLSSLTLITLAPSLILLPIYSSTRFFLWLSVFSVGYASASILMEAIITNSLSRGRRDGKIIKQNTSTELGLLYIPIRLAEFFVSFFGGYLISMFGYFSMFLLFSFLVVVFLAYASRVLKVHLFDFSYVYKHSLI